MTIAARLVAYTPNGPRLGTLTPNQWSASTPHNGIPAATVTLHATDPGAHYLHQPVELALEIATQNQPWTEIPNGRYLRLVRDGDATQTTPTWSYQLPGYAHLLNGIPVLPHPNPTETNTDTDGKRKFLTANAGQIIHTILTEAHTFDPQIVPGLNTNFTTSTDSNGQPWAKVITIYYEPGISLATIIDNLATQGVLDWRMQGRTLEAYNPDTALAVDNTATRVHDRDSTSAPVKGTLEGLLHLALLRGDNGQIWHRDNPSAPAPWGKTVSVINQGGVRDEGTAMSLIQNALDEGSVERVQYTRAVRLGQGAATPYIDYQAGDYITARDIDGQWATLRVFQIGLAAGDEGFEVTLTLGDLFEDAMIRQAKRTKGIVGGATSDGGSGARPAPPEPANRKPAAPQGLVVTTSHYYDQRGVSHAAILANYDPATQGEDGVALTIASHELHGRPVGSTEPYRLLTSVAGSEDTIGHSPLPVQQIWDFRVRAIAENGIPSGWSNTVRVELAQDTTPPPPPSAPQLTTRLGTITVAWDGKTYLDTDMPADFDYCEIQTIAPDAPLTEPGRINHFVEPVPLESETGRWRLLPAATGEDVTLEFNDDTAWVKWGPDSPNGVASGLEIESVLPAPAPAGPVPVAINVGSDGVFGVTRTWQVTATLYDGNDQVVGHTDLGAAVEFAGHFMSTEWHPIDVTATAPWSRVVVRVAATGGQDPNGWLYIKNATTAPLPYFDGDTPNTEETHYEWTGTPGQSESVALGPAAESRAELRDLPGFNSTVLADIPYRTQIGVQLVAIDTSGNRSTPSETVYIATEPLVADDILEPIIGDGAIVDIDGSKIHPGSIETGAIKVGHSNVWADLLTDPDLQEGMDKPEYTFGEDETGPYLDINLTLVNTRPPNGEAWLEKAGGGGALWINLEDLIGDGNTAPVAFSVELFAQTGGTLPPSVLVYLLGYSVLTPGQPVRLGSQNWSRSSDPTQWNHPAAQDITGVLDDRLGAISPGTWGTIGFEFLTFGPEHVIARIRRPRLTRGLYGTMIMPGSIYTEQIAAGSIEAHNIAANAITADKINAGAITAQKIQANAIDTTRLAATAITSKHTITGATIQTSATALRGIKLTSTALSAYNSSGQRTVYISGTTGSAELTGTLRTGLGSNQVVISDGIFRGRPGIRLDTGSTSGAQPTIQSLGVGSDGFPAGALVLNGRETTINSSGRADLVLKHGGNFELAQNWGTHSGIGIETDGWVLENRGRILGDRTGGFYGGQHQMEARRTNSNYTDGQQVTYTLGAPRPTGSNVVIAVSRTTVPDRAFAGPDAETASTFRITFRRDNATAFYAFITLYWS